MQDGDGEQVRSCKYQHQFEVLFFENWGDKHQESSEQRSEK
jgi:hypothetical protein